MGKYDDIINLPHHVSDFHRPMSLEKRAAQFAPFAALNGHEEAIAETGRLTEHLIELSEEERDSLALKLKYALTHGCIVSLKYFVPDLIKKGGRYLKIKSKINKIDEFEHSILLKNGMAISLDHIIEIRIEGNH